MDETDLVILDNWAAEVQSQLDNSVRELAKLRQFIEKSRNKTQTDPDDVVRVES